MSFFVFMRYVRVLIVMLLKKVNTKVEVKIRNFSLIRDHSHKKRQNKVGCLHLQTFLIPIQMSD